MRWMCWVATYGGIGYIPKAPGTWGTLGAVPLVWALSHVNDIGYMVAAFALIVVSILAADIYDSEAQSHDSKEVVIDEVVGYAIAMTWLPMTWQAFVLSFLLFRLLDIFKPFPISYLDKNIKGGLGVTIDDVAAGLVTNMILQAVYANTNWLGASLGAG